MPTIILTNSGSYSEPSGTWGGSPGTERFINSAGTARFSFTGLTAGLEYAIALAYVEFSNRVTNTAWSVAGTSGSPSGTINQQNAPTSFISGGNNYQFFNQKFIPTGTTLTLDISYPGSPSPAGNYTEVVAGWLDLVSAVTPIPTLQSGDWGTAATWLFGAVPAAAIPVSIGAGHDITITGDRTVGDGTSTLFINAASTCTLTITGATLELKGHAQFGVDTYSSGMRTWLTVQSSGATRGILRLNGNAGVTPHVLFGRQTKVVLVGDITIETKSGSAGNQGYCGQYASSTEYLSVDGSSLTSGLFNRLGSVTNDGFKCDLAGASSILKLKHCTFDANCVAAPSLSVGDGGATLSLTDNTWQNNAGKRCMSTNNNNSALTSGTREILRNVFYGQPFFSSARDVTIKHNFFNQYFEGNDDATTWLWDYNFVRKSDGFETIASGGCSTTFWMHDAANGDQTFVLVSRLTSSWIGNIFQRDVNGVVECIGMTEGGSQARDITVRNNLILKSSAGGSSGQLSSSFNNSGGGSFNPRLIAYHNTVWVPAGFNGIGNKAIGAMVAGQLITAKSNIFIRAGGSVTGTYGIGYDLSSPAAALTNAVAATEITNNCKSGMDTVPAGHWSGTSGDTGVENGTAYNMPMSGATVPGLNDVNADPNFVNGDARLETYAVSIGSVAGTDALKRDDAMAYLIADLTRIETSLIPYFQTQFKVRNSSLNNAGHDGATIGAMPFLPAVDTYTLVAPSPAKGDLQTNSSNFTVTPSQTFTGTITPSDGGFGGTFTPSSLTWAAASDAKTFVYKPVTWGSRTISTTNSGTLTDPSPVAYLAMVQLGKSGTASSSGSAAGNVSPWFGGFNVFANGAWLQEFTRDISGDPVDDDSAAIINWGGSPTSTIHIDFSATGAGTTAFGGYGIPFNVVPGTQAALNVTYHGYPGAEPPDAAHPSNLPPIPINPTGSFEGIIPASSPPTTQGSGDQHYLEYVRNETTGGVDTLWDINNCWTQDAGATFHANGAAKFNLVTGAPRPLDITSADAAGLPIAPLTLKYEEVASGDVGHCIRVAIPFTRNRLVWPARCSTGGGSLWCMGGRARLTLAYYTANRSNFTGQALVIFDAMRKYGLINADISGTGYGSGPFICGVTDDRWDLASLAAIGSIPISAFEIAKQYPGYTVSGATSGPAGVPVTFTLAKYPVYDSNYSGAVYLYVDGVNGGPGLSTTQINLADLTPSGTFTYTPPDALQHTLQFNHGNQIWVDYPAIIFNANSGGGSITGLTGEVGLRPYLEGRVGLKG